MQAGVVTFGKQVDNDILYRGTANQPSHAYSSLYLSDFLTLYTLNDEIFRQRFVMQVDNDVLFCRIANQPSNAYSFCFCTIFFLSMF